MAKTITLVGASNQPKRNSPYRGNDELVFGALITDDVLEQDTFLEWPARCFAISATAIRIEPTAAPFYDLDEADTGLTPTEMLTELAGVYGGSGGAAKQR